MAIQYNIVAGKIEFKFKIEPGNQWNFIEYYTEIQGKQRTYNFIFHKEVTVDSRYLHRCKIDEELT